MRLHLDTANGVPIYLQIVQQVKYLVAVGRLQPGEELPTIRALAEQLVVNPNTVARAYRDLEQAGVVVKRSTTGTFVSDEPFLNLEAFTHVARRAEELVREAVQRHVAADDLVELVRQRYRAVTQESHP